MVCVYGMDDGNRIRTTTTIARNSIVSVYHFDKNDEERRCRTKKLIKTNLSNNYYRAVDESFVA